MSSKTFLKGWPTDPLLAKMAARNVSWLYAQQALLGTLYLNKWVAVKDQKVVAVADTEDELDRQILKRQLAQGFPVTTVHISLTSDPAAIKRSRDIVKGAIGAKPPSLLVPPWTKPHTPQYASVQEVHTHLVNLQYRSVSFDLHGTLVHPRTGWNLRIWAAFRKVLRQYGYVDVVKQLEQLFGKSGIADYAAKVAKKYYQSGAPFFEEFPELYQDPRVRWSIANVYALAEFIAGNPGDTNVLKRRVGSLILKMGIEVHEQISGSDSKDWYTTEEQRAVVKSALSRGLLVMILSNGSYSSVAECTKRYFPEIPPWQILTPEMLRGNGKPGPISAALLLFSMGCALVRNAIEGRPAAAALVAALPRRSPHQLRKQWRASRAKSRAWFTDQLFQEPDQVMDTLKQSFVKFCAGMGLDSALTNELLILPHQHLHVGNSDYHDALPLIIRLGLPFTCLLYAPDAPS